LSTENIKIVATVVLYNPDDIVYDNIATYVSFIDKLIVIDNSTKHNTQLINKIETSFNNMIYINNNDNLGIATALNIACDRAMELGYEWILTMDQDSKFVNFEEYKYCLSEIIKKEKDIAIVTLKHTHDVGSIKIESNLCGYEEKDIVITSGNFVNLYLFDKIGRFDDSLFIDMVDYDFSHKVIVNGYKIVQMSQHYLIHQLGEVFMRKNFLTGKVKEKIEHNPQRVYYMTRNRLYLSKKYSALSPREYSLLKTVNILFIHDVIKILLYEDNKIDKLYAKCLGLYHFVIGRYGKYDI